MLLIRRILNLVRFKVHSQLRWSRPGYSESPIGNLSFLDPELQSRIRSLKEKYQVSFEDRLSRENTLDNYLYLDLLERSQREWNWRLQNCTVLDVGSKNFYYVGAMHSFFKPKSLLGIEVDGYTVYHDGHSRKDYAEYYLQPYIEAQYQVSSLEEFSGSFDLITSFYPFVFKETCIRWALPLHFFDPQRFFDCVSKLLAQNGHLFMVNHGMGEWEKVQEFLQHKGLSLVGSFVEASPLISREENPVVSVWKKN